MTYEKALAYFTSRDWQGSKLGMERVQELLFRMGNPQKKLKYVHIAGTNGKGSTAAMIANVLKESGYNTGLYTSPNLQHFNERIQVNGTPISDQLLIETIQQVEHHAQQMEDHPTEFELVTATAFAFFEIVSCDIVVLEVGLGGRMDATNIIERPEVSVITNIGLDHTAELGNTKEAIAAEKAGIIKQNCDVVLYQQESSVYDVIQSFCTQKKSRLRRVDFSLINQINSSLVVQQFDYKEFCGIKIHLLGKHQQYNAAVAIETLLTLREKGWVISDDAIYAGLEGATWPGRFEVLAKNPVFIVDGGHNPQCIEAIVFNLKQNFPGVKVVFMIGVLKDKNFEEMITPLLPLAKCFVTVTPPSNRAIDARELANVIENLGGSATPCESITEAVHISCKLAGESAVVCALGSLYMVAEIRADSTR